MTVVEILPDFFFVQRGFLNGNHFVFRSDTPVLIDTAYVADFDITRKILSDLEIDLSRVSSIINTHCHCDHIGGNRKIQDISGCNIALHEIGKYFMDMKDDWSTLWRYFAQEAEFFECSQGLKDGDRIDVGPCCFDIIYTPGHASDGIVMYDPENRILISSDTLWEYDMAVMTTRVEGSRALFTMLESLDKISDLKVDMVYPGHGAAFRDFDGALQRARTRLERFINDPTSIGLDLLKKLVVYTLMMKKGFDDSCFFDYLMRTPWFVETVDLYFSKDYRNTFNSVMSELMDKGITFKNDGRLLTTVIP